MKNLYNLLPKAYKEGYEILNLLSDEEKRKIPNDIWHFLESHMDKNHVITSEDITKNNLQDDTNTLLAIIFKEYLATDYEKKVIKEKEKIVENRKNQEATERYNPNELFKKTKKFL